MYSPNILSRLSSHAGRLERWAGKDTIEALSKSMEGWYARPIAVAGVPGDVYALPGGDFAGPVVAGQFASRVDYTVGRLRRAEKRWREKQSRTLNAGFSSLSDLISEISAGGKARHFSFQKVGTTGVVAAANTLWYVGNLPAAGAAAGAAPGGTVPTDATTGAFPFTNPTGGDTLHFINAHTVASTANTLLLYDRLFSVTKTMNSTGTEAVTGVPTRYQSTTATDKDYIGGNFLMIECRTALPATAHNWTTCLYTDHANASSTLPSVTGNSSNIQYRLDQPASQWFCPLENGDQGIKALTQMQCSAAVASGAIDFTIGHPITFLLCPVANLMMLTDGINSAVSLERVFDDACLAFLEVTKPTTTATTYSGKIMLGAG